MSSVKTAEELLIELRQYQLLTAEQLDTLTPNGDGQALAKDIFKRGWMTKFQLAMALNGRAAELTLGQYRLLDRIGSGGMGQVYKALQGRLGRVVAVKVLKKELVANSVAVARFQREVRSAAQLSHPNIVSIYDADSVDGTHFLAMEYVEGRDLSQIVRESGPLPVHVACDVIRQAAMGLHHAHERGLVHRDIKPSNLLLTQISKNGANVIKILDMGLARSILTDGRDQDASGVTQDGLVLGTPDFMAPEQAKNSRTVDARADYYSLGCTMFYLLTGRVPFPEGNTIEKLLKHQFDQPPPISNFRNDTPEAVNRIMLWMMAKRPEDRPPSGTAIVAAIEQLQMSSGPAPALPPGVPVPPSSASGQLNAVQGSSLRANLPPTLTQQPTASQTTSSASPFDFDDLPPPLPGSQRKASSTGVLPAVVTTPANWPKWVLPSIIGGGLFLILLCSGMLFTFFSRRSVSIEPTKPEPTTQATIVRTLPTVRSEPKPPPATGLFRLHATGRFLPDKSPFVGVIEVGRLLDSLPRSKHLKTYLDSEAKKIFAGELFLKDKEVSDILHRVTLGVKPGTRDGFVLIYEGPSLGTRADVSLHLIDSTDDVVLMGKEHHLYHWADSRLPMVDKMWLAVLDSHTLVLANQKESLLAALHKGGTNKSAVFDEELNGLIKEFDPQAVLNFAGIGGTPSRDSKTFRDEGIQSAKGYIRMTDGLAGELNFTFSSTSRSAMLATPQVKKNWAALLDRSGLGLIGYVIDRMHISGPLFRTDGARYAINRSNEDWYKDIRRFLNSP